MSEHRPGFIALFVVAACGSAGGPGASRPAAGQMRMAPVAADAAEWRGGRPTDAQCGDTVMGDQVTSGGERLLLWQPCWSAESTVAARHREDARVGADVAADLAEVEQASCSSLPEAERSHTPLAHREDVVSVAPI